MKMGSKGNRMHPYNGSVMILKNGLHHYWVFMVKKIRKPFKKGPKADYSVPMVLVMTGLYGLKREGKDFFWELEKPEDLRMILSDHFGYPVILGERPLSREEYLDWGLRGEPGKLANMFVQTRLIPMGPYVHPVNEGKEPRLGILPLLCLVKGAGLKGFLNDSWVQLPEVTQASLNRIFYSSFNMISGYDLLLYPGPIHPRAINEGISWINGELEAEMERSSSRSEMKVSVFEAGTVGEIPWYQPFSREA